MFDCEYGNQEHFAMIAISTIPGRTCQSRWAVGRKSLVVSLALSLVLLATYVFV